MNFIVYHTDFRYCIHGNKVVNLLSLLISASPATFIEGQTEPVLIFNGAPVVVTDADHPDFLLQSARAAITTDYNTMNPQERLSLATNFTGITYNVCYNTIWLIDTHTHTHALHIHTLTQKQRARTHTTSLLIYYLTLFTLLFSCSLMKALVH